MAIVDEFDDDGTNTLDIDEFENVIREFDWTNEEWLSAMSQDLYELSFGKPKLGFSVANKEGTGTIVVNRLHDPDLLLPVESETGAEEEQARLVSLMMGGGAFARPPQQRLYLGDTVVAINGAPLGWVTDHQVLADKVGPLERPVKVTFRREYVDNYLPATDPEPLRAAPQDLKV